MKGAKNWMNPRDVCSSFLLVGVAMLWRSATFSGSGSTPLASYFIPKNVIESVLMEYLSVGCGGLHRVPCRP